MLKMTALTWLGKYFKNTNKKNPACDCDQHASNNSTVLFLISSLQIRKVKSRELIDLPRLQQGINSRAEILSPGRAHYEKYQAR
ncbi:hypothetical protein CapIbe_012145 [Capra ibex]